MTVEIASSYVANHSVPADKLPELIRSIHGSLISLGEADATAAVERPKPAVPIRRSIQPDYIVCLEDGKKLKMLKRYLRTNYDMTPDEYRTRWGLSPEYPMVAPNYAKKRADMAREIGLGRRRRRG